MATKQWVGNAPVVRQVNVLTPGSVSIGSIYTITLGYHSVSFTATTTVAADVITALLALCNASDAPAEFLELSSNGTNMFESSGLIVFYGLSNTPFIVFTSVGGTGSPTFANSVLQRASGPNWFDNPANWIPNGNPASGDTVIIADSSVSILYSNEIYGSGGTDPLWGASDPKFNYEWGLKFYYQASGSAYNLFDNLFVYSTFTGNIGSADFNSAGYLEYRGRTLMIASKKVYIDSSGSGLCRIANVDNIVTAQSTLIVNASNLYYDIIGGYGNAVTATELHGPINIENGTVVLNNYYAGTSTFYGRITQLKITGGATVDFGGCAAITSSIIIDSGTLTMSGKQRVVNLANMAYPTTTPSIPGFIINQGNMNVTSATAVLDSFSLYASSKLMISCISITFSGTLSLYDTATLDIAGTTTISGSGPFQLYAYSNQVSLNDPTALLPSKLSIRTIGCSMSPNMNFGPTNRIYAVT